MSVALKNFADDNELIRFAKGFLEGRVDSLQKDVAHCLQPPFAPFPAIAYCFATIDLMGALASGNAKKKGSDPTGRAKAYMEKYMFYPSDRQKLLMDIFRHKVVHLAQPNPVCDFAGKQVTWKYHHDNATRHLKLQKLEKPVPFEVTSTLTLNIEYLFEISLVHFAKDIRDSVIEPGGYLNTLKTDAALRQNFDLAIGDIFDPKE